MSETERDYVVATLPSDFPVSDSNPPEGDRHFEAYANARETLDRWYRERGKSVYISGNLPVYYPGERMFSPDVIAVLDVEPHARESWIVSREGHGLDFALEVIVSGRRRKDLRDNVQRYATLGITEYFVFDRSRMTLHAYRLTVDGAYSRLMPQSGRYASNVLGLDLSLDGDKLRFSIGDSPLLYHGELINKLGALVNDAEQRANELEIALEEEQKLREEEQKLREEEQKLREVAEAEVQALRAELEKLRRERV
jgi:Uma2 family endonuclease